MLVNTEGQLELFDLRRSTPPPRHQHVLGRLAFHLRTDQCILAGVAGLIGLTVVFACGVERGKQLARTERAILARHEPEPAPPAPTAKSVETPAQAAAPLAPSVTGKPAAPRTPASDAPASPPTRQTAKNRYAIQVVTYSRPQLAKQELQRLRARGEQAFLVMRDGRTSVFVGPFPSKVHASEKLVRLKSRYQDCFVKTL